MGEAQINEIADLIGPSSYVSLYKIGEHHAYQARKGKYVLSFEILKVLKDSEKNITKRIASDFLDALVLVAWGSYSIRDKNPGTVSTTKSIVENNEEVASISFKEKVVRIKTTKDKFRIYDTLDVFEAYVRMLKN